MLHQCRNLGATRGHPYPKIMLAFLLVLQYWRETNYCAYEMMKSNMSMFNEELGELTFSILARSVLSDHTKDDFAHMDRLFRLLRVYRDVKSDVVADNAGSNSLNWRHKIDKNGEEVRTTELFFKQIIRQMVSGTYKSYDGSAKCYTNATNGATMKVNPTSPIVYMTKVELADYVQTQLSAIRVDMRSNFLYPYKHIWPECINHDDDHDDGEQVVEMNVAEEVNEDNVDADLLNEEENKELAVVDIDGIVNEDNFHEGADDVIENGPDPDHGVNPYDGQSDWRTWGDVMAVNVMVGKRKTSAVTTFGYTGRRVNGRFPDPSM